MLTWALDRDLLVFEPNLFRDAGWAGQRLTRGAGAIAGSTLTLSAADVPLDAAGVAAGHVVVAGSGAAYEIVERSGAMTAVISRLRGSRTEPVIPPSGAAPAIDIAVHTFIPQIAEAHRRILEIAGLEPEGSAAALRGAVHEAQVLPDPGLTRLESLGALALIWAAAASAGPASAPNAASRADWYHARFDRERERIEVRIDLNGDGAPEARRLLRSTQLRRG